MKQIYQESLNQWIDDTERGSKQPQEDRIAWTKRQVALLAEEEPVHTLREMEILCKKRGILIWSIKYYHPEYYNRVIEKTRKDTMQDIIEDIGREGCSLPQLRKKLKEINELSGLDSHHWNIAADDLREYDPQWFQHIFKQKYVTLPESVKNGTSPRFKKILDI
jgi:hypothetical protein